MGLGNRSLANMIAIASDHAGFPLKEALKESLLEKGLEILDAGTYGEESVDYPDFAVRVAEKVSTGELEKGILVCGSGIGMSIVANKFPGVRAALCFDEEMARMSRLHNNANVLVLGGRWTDARSATKIAATWLTTPFEGGRHEKRVGKIATLEKKLKMTNKTI